MYRCDLIGCLLHLHGCLRKRCALVGCHIVLRDAAAADARAAVCAGTPAAIAAGRHPRQHGADAGAAGGALP